MGEKVLTGDSSFESRGVEPGWQPVLDQALRDRTHEIIQTLAERLSNPAMIQSMLPTNRHSNVLWEPSSLYCGFAGIALAFSALARSFPEERWSGVSRDYVRLAADATHRQALVSPSLCNGSSGLAFLLSSLCRLEPRYQKASRMLTTQVALQVQQMPWYREASAGVAASDYDVINGAAGILVALLTATEPASPQQDAINRLLSYLIWLAHAEETCPRWYIPADLLPDPIQAQTYPQGYFDCGLAHGIAGPLAALALAWRAGYRLPGQREAMVVFSSWLISHQISDEWGINWPYGIPFDQPGAGKAQPLAPARTAWCYGIPGIARSLWLAGTELDDAQLLSSAISALETIERRPVALWYADAPTLCHGLAGLLAIFLRFANETGSGRLREQASVLLQSILDAFEPDAPLGFHTLLDERGESDWVDDPTLLNGVAGILLVLLAASTPVAPDWDRALLLT